MHDGRVDGVEGALITRLHTEVGAALRWVQQSGSGAPGNAALLFLHSISVGVHLETMIDAQAELCESSDSVQADTPS